MKTQILGSGAVTPSSSMSQPQIPVGAQTPPPQEGSVAVMLRVRPPSPRERAAPPVLRVLNQNVVLLSLEEPGSAGGTARSPARSPGRRRRNLKFVFDHVFDEGATQEEVFQHTTLPLLDTLLAGYNCSGKSWHTPLILAGAPDPSVPGLDGLSRALDLIWKPPCIFGNGVTQQQPKTTQPEACWFQRRWALWETGWRGWIWGWGRGEAGQEPSRHFEGQGSLALVCPGSGRMGRNVVDAWEKSPLALPSLPTLNGSVEPGVTGSGQLPQPLAAAAAPGAVPSCWQPLDVTGTSREEPSALQAHPAPGARTRGCCSSSRWFLRATEGLPLPPGPSTECCPWEKG